MTGRLKILWNQIKSQVHNGRDFHEVLKDYPLLSMEDRKQLLAQADIEAIVTKENTVTGEEG